MSEQKQEEATTSEKEVAELEKEKVQKEPEIDTQGVVEELKLLRTKNAELLKQLGAKPADKPVVTDIEATVQEVLRKEKEKSAETNRTTAISKFRDEHKEFHIDNDPSGIKTEALLREFATFNTNGFTTVEEFMNVLDKARRLIVRPQGEAGERITPDASTGKDSSAPTSKVSTKLSDKEQKVVKQLGWTEEKYLALKQAQPDYVAKLISQAP